MYSKEIEHLLNINCSYWNSDKKELLMNIIQKNLSFGNKKNINIRYDETSSDNFFELNSQSITINNASIKDLIHELTHYFHYINSTEESKNQKSYDYPKIFRKLDKIITQNKFTISNLSILLQDINKARVPIEKHLSFDPISTNFNGYKDNDERMYFETLLSIEVMIDSILFGNVFDNGISVEYSKNFDQNYVNIRGSGHSREYFEDQNASSNSSSIYDSKDKGLIFAELLASYSSVIFIDPDNIFLQRLKDILGKEIFELLDNYLYKIYHIEEIIIEKNKRESNDSKFKR